MAARYKGNREAARTLRAKAEIYRTQAATHWLAKDRHEASARQAEAAAAQADADADALDAGRSPQAAAEIPF